MMKSAKIVVFALSLALVIGAMVGFSVSAEGTAPEIVSKNIKVDGNFSLMFAVDPATVEGSDVTINIYNKAPAADVAAIQTITKAKADTEKIDLDADGTAEFDAIVFETKGVSAKDIADVWYITTTSAGVTSEAVTYSVREYAFERLYKNGTIFAAETDEDTYKYDQQQFYLEILDVGSAAQQLLVNYNNPTPEKLAKEYTYAAVVGGTYTVGETTESRGFVNTNDVLTLTSTDASVKGWDVYTFGQNGGQISVQTVADGGSVTVKGNIAAVPYQLGVTAGKYFEEIGDSIYNFNEFTYKNFVGEAGTPYLSKSGFSTSGNFLYSIGDSGNAEHGNVLTLSKNNVGSSSTWLSAPIVSKSDEANCVVFEYDFMFTKAGFYYNSGDIKAEGTESSTEPFTVAFNSEELSATIDSRTKTQWVQFKAIDYDSKFTTDSIGTCGGDALRLPGATDSSHDILPNTWHTITYEIYTDARKLVVYLDGEVVSVTNSGSNTGNIANLNSITFTLDWRLRNCEMMFDNMVGVKIEKQFTLGN